MSKLVSKKSNQKKSLIDSLISSPALFSFAKAIDISLSSQKIDISNLQKSDMDKVIIKSALNFQSKFSDINHILGLKDCGIVEIHTNMSGVAGIDGMLPDCYLEDYVMRGGKKTKQAVSDFFDIFNNKIFSLRYIFLKKSYVPCMSTFVEKSRIGKMMLSLAGFVDEKKCQLIPEQLKISAQHFFWKNTRSSEGLRCILASFFEVPIQVNQFSGGFVEAGEELQTRVGNKNEQKYNALGVDSYLGSKTWNAMKGIEILIGPLPFEQYMYFLPKASKYDDNVSVLQKVKEIVKMYVPSEIDVKIHIFLEQCGVNATLLNGVKRLSRDSFIQGKSSKNIVFFTERV